MTTFSKNFRLTSAAPKIEFLTSVILSGAFWEKFSKYRQNSCEEWIITNGNPNRSFRAKEKFFVDKTKKCKQSCAKNGWKIKKSRLYFKGDQSWNWQWSWSSSRAFWSKGVKFSFGDKFTTNSIGLKLLRSKQFRILVQNYTITSLLNLSNQMF